MEIHVWSQLIVIFMRIGHKAGKFMSSCWHWIIFDKVLSPQTQGSLCACHLLFYFSVSSFWLPSFSLSLSHSRSFRVFLSASSSSYFVVFVTFPFKNFPSSLTTQSFLFYLKNEDKCGYRKATYNVINWRPLTHTLSPSSYVLRIIMGGFSRHDFDLSTKSIISSNLP